MLTKLLRNLNRYFRTDLQLHFLWSFFLTTFAVFFPFMIWTGLIATIIKEALDLWIKGRWNWDDVICGIAGWITALLFLQQI
tara:strand:+ start:60 stop:305 length:246 start_codon:yes stop_codon:yes gene_type:complete